MQEEATPLTSSYGHSDKRFLFSRLLDVVHSYENWFPFATAIESAEKQDYLHKLPNTAMSVLCRLDFLICSVSREL
jgi:hypothetical protein